MTKKNITQSTLLTSGAADIFSAEPTFAMRGVNELKVRSDNPRKHPKVQIRAIAESIRAHGFNAPILIDDDNQVIAGHGRLEAAKLVGLSIVPTVCRKGLSQANARAYMLADNKLTDRSIWDDGKLAIHLKELSEMALDFEMEATGFEAPEIDLRIQSLQLDDQDVADDFETSDDLAVSKAGDIWSLGENRILCGNALDAGSYQLLLADKQASAVFVDPPYNVKIAGHVRGRGKNHAEFIMGSGMSDPEFEQFLSSSLQLCGAHALPGALIYACMDWRHASTMLAAGQSSKFDFLNLCVWVKTNGGMGSLYRSRHELVFVYRNGGPPHLNNIQLGRFGRNRTNVWNYAGANGFKRSAKVDDFESHPTVKPIRLVSDAILDCTNRGDIVLDTFLGSGTTILAAERTGRRCYGIELDPLHVDTAIQRWQTFSKQTATNQHGQTYEQCKCAQGIAQ